jgi:hypothetical protein
MIWWNTAVTLAAGRICMWICYTLHYSDYSLLGCLVNRHYSDYSLLGCLVNRYQWVPMIWKNLLSPSSEKKWRQQFFYNAGTYLPNYMVSHIRKTYLNIHHYKSPKSHTTRYSFTHGLAINNITWCVMSVYVILDILIGKTILISLNWLDVCACGSLCLFAHLKM